MNIKHKYKKKTMKNLCRMYLIYENSVEIDLDKYKNSSIENIISLLKNKDYLIQYGVIRLEAKMSKEEEYKREDYTTEELTQITPDEKIIKIIGKLNSKEKKNQKNQNYGQKK